MKKERIKKLCISGIFCAIVFITTAYLHIPSHTGYTHVGDAFIYLAACLLPTPYAIFAGAGGALLADCLTGYAIWAPGTIIIKTAAILLFNNKSNKILTLKNLLMLIPAAVFCIGGYYLYEAAILGDFLAPLAGIMGYIMQVILSSALFLILAAALDKINIKKRIGE